MPIRLTGTAPGPDDGPGTRNDVDGRSCSAFTVVVARRRPPSCLTSALFGGVALVVAAPAPRAQVSADPPPFETVVTAPAPLHGSRLPRDRVPMNVQTVTGEELQASQSLDLTEYLSDQAGSVTVNGVQGNPLQPELQYRGFAASPLVGTPQGLSVFLNGMRLNEAFGDTVNWDLLPTNAIRSVNLVPGSNPLFGLNTLGGALSLETKTGFSDPGTRLHLSGGSFLRRQAQLETGAHGDKVAIFFAGRYFAEAGWRDDSPSRAAGAFLSGSYSDGPSFVDLSLAAGDTRLVGNGPAPTQLLDMDRSAIFTSPDITKNRMFLAMLRGERTLGPQLRLSGALFERWNRAATANGDQRDWAACAAPGQTAYVCSTDAGGTETVLVQPDGTPIPYDQRADSAANNTTRTTQQQYGVNFQIVIEAPLGARENHLFLGASAAQGRTSFRSQSTLATLNDDRQVIDLGALDPTSPVAVDTVVNDLGVYASDTASIRQDLFLSLAGRLDHSALSMRDRLGGALGGEHSFGRFNPSAGLAYQPRPVLGVYGSYGESSRVPTPIELTCADPTDPCRLPNGFVSDPPLRQVVARTFEAGTRGRWTANGVRLDYAAAAFRTTNHDDILFISSGMVANSGYFRNVGDTRRQGVEASLRGHHRMGGHGGRLDWSVQYTLLDATFQSAFSSPSANHPDASAGQIAVPVGARLPSLPAHVAKASVVCGAPFGLTIGLTAIANSAQFYRGDEANLLSPLPGYVVVNLTAAYQLGPHVAVRGRVNNLFDSSYSTFGVLGDAAGVLGQRYGDPRFRAPGAPIAGWLGLDLAL